MMAFMNYLEKQNLYKVMEFLSEELNVLETSREIALSGTEQDFISFWSYVIYELACTANIPMSEADILLGEHIQTKIKGLK